MCRTSGFLLLRPPPPSPSRLHGGFLLLPLQKASGPEWCAKGWQLECFLALSFTLTLILLQCISLYLLLPVSTPCLPFSSHTSSAIQLLPLFFFFSKSIIFHTPFNPSMALSRPFLCKASLSPLLLVFQRLPSFVLVISPSTGERLCNAGDWKPNPPLLQQLQEDVSSFFFKGKTEEAGPPTCSYHTAAAVWHCMQTAVRRTDRKMDRQRERERKRKGGGA